MTATFQRELYRDVIEELKPLLLLHWKEIALDQDTIPLEPMYDEYQRLEDIGILNMFTMRVDGKIQGYIVGFIKRHLHYQSLLYYANDIYFVSPDFRGVNSMRFFKAFEKHLKELDVQQIVMYTKQHKSVQPFLEHLGYSAVDIVMKKNI